MSTSIVLFWRRTDIEGLERAELVIQPEGVSVTSTVICLEDDGFRLDHQWQLDAEWRAQSVTIERWNRHSRGALRLERAGTGWRVDGTLRPDLEGAEEPDLSVTPLCNTWPIHRMMKSKAESVVLDTAFIDGPALTVVRSKQRYLRQGPRQFRFVDLGLSKGFEADLVVDEAGLIVHYEHLFERVSSRVPD